MEPKRKLTRAIPELPDLPALSDAADSADLLRQAVLSGNVELAKSIMELQERWERGQSRKAFDNAMAAAKAEIPAIVKDQVVDFTSQRGRTNYKYEALADVAKVVDPILAKHNLFYRYRTNSDKDTMTVTCIVSHRDGYFEENSLTAPNDVSGNKNPIQAIGSTQTYLQRYTLKGALGLSATKDDDAQVRNNETVTQEQIDELETLVNDVGGERSTVLRRNTLKYFNLTDFSQLLTSDYLRAVAAINKKTGADMNGMIQGSQEWIAARIGKVTASRIADMTAKTKSGWGASRANYMAELIAERLTGVPAPSYTNAAMEWGTTMEPQARSAYEFYSDVDVELVGFIEHPTIAMSGASPDGLVGTEGIVEFKCPNTSTHIDTLFGQAVPGKYISQCQWQMACTGCEWCDWVSFDPRMPEEMRLFVRRIKRNDASIAQLEKDVVTFLAEIDAKVDALRKAYGKAKAA